MPDSGPSQSRLDQPNGLVAVLGGSAEGVLQHSLPVILALVIGRRNDNVVAL